MQPGLFVLGLLTLASTSSFPVFPTRDLGTAGLLICYDLVVPETARCLALQGADIIIFPTMGGAAIGDGDIGVQALRVRAAENFIWLVVAQRGSGSMIILAQAGTVAKLHKLLHEGQVAKDSPAAIQQPVKGR